MGFLDGLFGKKTDFAALVEEGAVIIDVRSPQEFKQGHIEGSKNIPVDQIGKRAAKIKKLGKPVVLCCASGMRSGRGTKMLQAEGIEAYNGGSWMGLKRKL